MWINSLNIENVYINNLFTDCRDGVNLIKVIDRVRPGLVIWKRWVCSDVL
jgi:plastin-1